MTDDRLSQFGDFVAQVMGLDFPIAKWPDLRRGLSAVAKDLGFDDTAACMRSLMSSPFNEKQRDALARHLTVGETYFFRERKSLDVFAEKIVPDLVRERDSTTRQIRIWCAACCTGEEAYSIAIILQRALPAWQDWDISLLATDINPNFLKKAEEGVFGAWSFRDAPIWIRDQYFRPVAQGRFEILPEIKRMVQFKQLNLAEDVYPSSANGTEAIDVIFCRNVLMYFSAANAAKVVEKLHRATANGGWLIVSPSELLHVTASSYATTKIQNAFFYRRIPKSSPAMHTAPAAALPQAEISIDEESLAIKPEVLTNAETLSFNVRRLANEGKLEEAQEGCDRWIAAEKLNPLAHYLRAVVLQEKGEVQEAATSFRRAIYLDQNFAMAHFSLGMIARIGGRLSEADRHFKNALHLLHQHEPSEILPQADGLTAGRFTEMILAMMQKEAA